MSDSGIGILKEDMPNLFYSFHRGRNASVYPYGELGLTIVKGIADLHRASVRVDSDINLEI